MSFICKCGWIIPSKYTHCSVCGFQNVEIRYGLKRNLNLNKPFVPLFDSSFDELMQKGTKKLVKMGYIHRTELSPYL